MEPYFDEENLKKITEGYGRMQKDMGHYGVYASFIPPASNYSVSNYQIIMNMIPELRRWIPGASASASARPWHQAGDARCLG